MLLKELRALDRIDKNVHVSWLKSLQNPDGGFGHQPGQPSDVANTYFAVRTLGELGVLDQVDRNKVVQFVLACEDPNGGFRRAPNQDLNQPLYPQFAYNAIFLLRKLSDLDKIDLQEHITWLKSLWRPDGGFWAGTRSEQSQMVYTYFASKALMQLRALDEINLSRLVKFILSLEDTKGGFRNTSSEQPQILHTYLAISLLEELRVYLSELFDEYVEELKKLLASRKSRI